MNYMEKEAYGEKLLKQYNIFEHFFPNYKGFEKVENRKNQMEGVDFIIRNNNGEYVYIDLKACIGPDYEDIVPLEITQYGVVTNTRRKKTDYFIYMIDDQFKSRAVLISYDLILKITEKQLESKSCPEYKSATGTGSYIKLEYLRLKSQGVKVYECPRT